MEKVKLLVIDDNVELVDALKAEGFTDEILKLSDLFLENDIHIHNGCVHPPGVRSWCAFDRKTCR